ncbi:MAG: AI-2E family transporter [Nitrospirae bacterium]|nr:AI-2E family transporter [Nitrospirota bacterium]
MKRDLHLLELAIVGLLGYLLYQIFSPFLTAIAWAVVFCVIFYPVYLFILKHVRYASAASIITVMIIALVIVGPLSYLSFSLVSEVTDLVTKTGRPESPSLGDILDDGRVAGLIREAGPYLGVSEDSAREFLIESGRKLAKEAVDHLSSGFTNSVGVAVNFVLMIFTVFFLFRDGNHLVLRVKDYLPFPELYKDRLTQQTKDMIVSTIYGGVVVAISQGVIGGVAFAVIGVGSSVLWGSVMALCSFLPAIGTAIVWVPASLLLFFQGAYLKAVALVLIGFFAIGTIDNVLKPLIIGGRTRMPAIIIFFTVLGGIKFFGLLGLVMGPLIFALFISVFEILRTVEPEKGMENK